ncbi:MAG: tRNA 2-thiouridine(34) synthase MnmA [Alphaproteobacteria bacterium]|nr:MAG: tRNA 2-thiouridine(34) synthase MnmA [Alphaproteobacteria bacterium]
MSGGVDSSVVAAMLKREGYDVVGVTLQLYDHGEAVRRAGACCAGVDIYDARRVADRLGIAHYVLNYEERFRTNVMESFAASYARGETPIPCVECNRTVKFRDLLETARDLGAEALATGHYARRVVTDTGVELHRAVDPVRDQSYFLFATTPEQLAFLRFPLGSKPSKGETRAMAQRFGLDLADKPDSQDICFVPTGRYADVVERLRPDAAVPGEIVHIDGRVLGQHEGVFRYTVGQRRGLGVATGEPLYVVALDAAKARVIVGPEAALARDLVTVSAVNWLMPVPGADGVAVMVKLRSAQPPIPARLVPTEAGARLHLAEPAFGVAPGQAAVAYVGDRVVAGGWIAASALTSLATAA